MLLKKINFVNTELLNELYEKHRNIFIISGHLGNWELIVPALPLACRYKIYGISKPMKNAFFNNYMNKIRNKFGSTMLPYKNAFSFMNRNINEKSAYFIAADQTPTREEINYRTNFLNQDTPVYLGVEKISKKLNMPIVFMNIQRSKRGFYNVEFTLLVEKPIETKDFEITEKHVRFLENIIIKNPDNWLWSHRRWKY